MSRNLIIRIAVAAVAIPIILWICYRGGGWLFGMVALFATLAIIEFLVNEGYKPGSFFFWLGLGAVALMLLSRAEQVSGWFWLQFLFSGASGVILFFLISSMIVAAGRQQPSQLFTKHSRLLWGVLYLGLLYPYVYLLGGLQPYLVAMGVSGGDWLLFLFGVLWIGDTAAMGVGKWIGKHKLAPSVSPNKTVEGFFGGIVGAVLVGIVIYFWKFQNIVWYHILILSVGCSIFGQLGDLVESMWKRSVGIKDSSVLIPGHGGVLDRFDSLLFAAPFMYFYRLLMAVS
jgi:phosphatidate cytidylyltransferase